MARRRAAAGTRPPAARNPLDPAGRIAAELCRDIASLSSPGVDWLQLLRAAGLGGVLADDMGLGKTVQALTYLAIEKASGRMDRSSLVVVPASMLPNWRREAERFTPDLKVPALHGLDRKSRFGEIAGHDLVLTTYPLLARDHAILKAQLGAWLGPAAFRRPQYRSNGPQ